MAETIAEMMVKLGVDAADLRQGFDDAADIIGGMGSRFSSAGAALTAGITAPILGIGAAAISAGLEVDDALDKIRIKSGETGAPLASLEESFRNIFTSVPTSASDAATAIGSLNAVLGLTGAPLETLSTQILNIARHTGSDLTPLITSATRAFGDWSIAAKDTGPALDYIWRVAQDANMPIGTLLDKIVQFGAPLRDLGYNFNEAAAMMGRFHAEGVNTETVMSGLKFAIGNWGKEGTTDFVSALRDAMEAIKTAPTDADAAGIAFETFGKRAGSDLGRAIREGRFELDAMVEKLRNSNETVDGASRATFGFAEQWVLLKNNITAAIEPLGTQLLTALGNINFQPVISAIQLVVNGFTSLPSSVQGAILVIGGLAAALGPALAAFGLMATGISNILPLLGSLGGAFTVINGIFTGGEIAAGATAVAGVGAAASIATPLLIAFGAAIAGWGLYKIITSLSDIGKGLDTSFSKLEQWNRGVRDSTADNSKWDATWADVNEKLRQGQLAGQTFEQTARGLGTAFTHVGASVGDFGIKVIAAGTNSTTASTGITTLKTATEQLKPVIDQVALAHNIAAEKAERQQRAAVALAEAYNKANAEIKAFNEHVARGAEGAPEVAGVLPPARTTPTLPVPGDTLPTAPNINDDPDYVMTGPVDVDAHLARARDLQAGLSPIQQAIKEGWDGLFAGAARGLTDLIFNGGRFGETMLGVLKDVGAQFVESFINIGLKAVQDWIFGADGLLGGFTQKLSGMLGGILGDVFGGGASAAVGGAASAAGQAAGGVAQGGGALGTAIGAGVSTGLQATVGMISGAVSAVTGVIGVFQTMGMNKSLDIIVLHTLQTANDLANLRRDEWNRETNLLTKLDDLWRTLLDTKDLIGGQIFQQLEALANPVAESETLTRWSEYFTYFGSLMATVEDLTASSKAFFEFQMAAASTGPPITINFHDSIISSEEVVNRLGERLTDEIRNATRG